MKIKVNGILLIAYLIAIFFVTKKFEFIAIGAAILLIFFESRIKDGIKNLLYIIVALLPFHNFLISRSAKRRSPLPPLVCPEGVPMLACQAV